MGPPEKKRHMASDSVSPELHKLMATSDFRRLENPDEQARYIAAFGFGPLETSKVLGIPVRTINNYRKCDGTTSQRGRRPLLTPAENQELLKIVLDAEGKHTPKKLREVQEEVKEGPYRRNYLLKVHITGFETHQEA